MEQVINCLNEYIVDDVIGICIGYLSYIDKYLMSITYRNLYKSI